MERFIQHEPLFVRHFTTREWPFPVHNHNHFELVFIHAGKGFHDLNGQRTSYQGKCLFLLAPADAHIFKITLETTFSVLKFSNRYLDGTSTEQEWNRLIDHLLSISNAHGACLTMSVASLDKIGHLMDMIVQEWTETGGASNEVIFYLIRSVFAIIKREVFQQLAPDHLPQEDLLISVMNHIHLNIQDPAALSLKTLSERFNRSPNHLSALFKHQMGIPLKKYIGDYKFKLIENRLKFSNALMKEISHEFGFADLSHFNKFMKNQAGINPKEIRKQ